MIYTNHNVLSPTCHYLATAQIDLLSLQNLSQKTPIMLNASIFAPCPLPFISYLSTHPSSGLSMSAAISPSLFKNRPGTAFGITCFHAEFPVVRGEESGKEHSSRGVPGILVGNVANNMPLVFGLWGLPHSPTFSSLDCMAHLGKILSINLNLNGC